MVKQERAERTRHALVCSAAEVFDRLGYERASLVRISNTAGVTKGALSFHFATKEELADAVEDLAWRMTRQAVQDAAAGGGTALQNLIDVTHALARLLSGNAVARAGLRLSRERDRDGQAEQPQWFSAWLPQVRVLLEEAARDGSLLPEADVQALAVLITCTVTGLETAQRVPGHLSAALPDPGPAGPLPAPGRAWLARIWHLLLPRIAPDDHTASTKAEGTL
ncbi:MULTISPECIES: ScbR family autoregulator-binding transcription factor [Streptomycetaceae]|uniref:ScbR family autoregulator-binding transcription factor n=1 Tax=Streptomycetaceae TaxID=2062 RepID=UPI000213F9D8|nr:ScbR family autoregulator-binding transcription factor [Streptantibioticus cattleyicolor]MYS62551.1 TetR family transcriptional regulator [Streptomyces sp. SID5468]CCB78482.1 BarB [Streptantibioticus cattleyicolor NRRL 8057 = DSM 46488]